jgi:hypothetical protein
MQRERVYLASDRVNTAETGKGRVEEVVRDATFEGGFEGP